MHSEIKMPVRSNPAAQKIVSVVTNASDTKTIDANVKTLLNEIQTGKWRTPVEQIRNEYACAVTDGSNPKKKVSGLKKSLPGVLWCGQFSNRNKPVADKLTAHSGLLCADLDDLGERFLDVRAKLVSSQHLFALFSSPTGNGIKAIFPIAADAKQHQSYFHAVAEYVFKLTGIKIDGACKDISRLCFVSYDPDLFQNPKAKIIEIKSSLNPASCMAASLCPCEPASTTSPATCVPTSSASLHPLHNNIDSVLANITARKEAKRAFSENYPHLVDFFARFVEPRFKARAHARNKFIVQVVPILYRAVAPENVLAIVGHFYDCNRALFNDTREQHMKEAKAMLESVADTYPKNLKAREREIYQALPDDERDAFRICRDLALLEKEKDEPQSFFLSFNHLGDRLGIYSMEAQRIMWQLEEYGIIKLLQKGTRRTAGKRGLAGKYQWLI